MFIVFDNNETSQIDQIIVLNDAVSIGRKHNRVFYGLGSFSMLSFFSKTKTLKYRF